MNNFSFITKKTNEKTNTSKGKLLEMPGGFQGKNHFESDEKL